MITYPLLSQTGRLGNQLWEIASTIGLASLAKTAPRFPLWDYEPFFRVPANWFGDTAGGTDATTLVPYMDERARPYLQDYELFRLVEDSIKYVFQPSEHASEILEPIWEMNFAHLAEPLISVHVRRGDNVTHPQGYHPLRSMQYYRDALELIPEGSIVVFSDDPDWCRDNIESATGREVAYIHHGVPRPREYIDRVAYENAPVLDWIDLQLMAACDHHVLSNSTYAWWGAFLSQDPRPIYPGNWFGRNVRGYTDSKLMFPPAWVEIPDATEGGV